MKDVKLFPSFGNVGLSKIFWISMFLIWIVVSTYITAYYNEVFGQIAYITVLAIVLYQVCILTLVLIDYIFGDY